MADMTGQVALVTGGIRGIGLAIWVARVHDESWLRRAADATTGLVRPEDVSV